MSHYSRRIWYHNSLRGRVAYCKATAIAVKESETTTEDAKDAAHQLYNAALNLQGKLVFRNPDFEKERKANAKSTQQKTRS